jgi:hypothetical protein
MPSTLEPAPPSGARHRSPPLLPVGIAYTALFLGSLVASALMARGGHFPSPFGPAAAAAAYFAENAQAVRLQAFLQLGAAVPLGIFTATLADRLRFLGMQVAGTVIALYGGLAAAIFLALSAMCQWVLAQPGVATAGGAGAALHLLAFVTGGPGHVVMLGLLLAGGSVPALAGRLLPRWLPWLGLALAALAELSWLSLLFPGAAWLLPAARFPAFVWILGVGALLPRSRRELAR